jgi:hypothetical protein
MTPATSPPLRACGRCTAAKNITGMVIIRARPGDYLCTRHQQWLRGPRRPGLAALPEVTAAQRRHYRHTRDLPGRRHRPHPPAGQRRHRPVAGVPMAPGAHRPLARAQPAANRHDSGARDAACRRDHPSRDARRRTAARHCPALPRGHAGQHRRPPRLPLPQQPPPARTPPSLPCATNRQARSVTAVVAGITTKLIVVFSSGLACLRAMSPALVGLNPQLPK